MMEFCVLTPTYLFKQKTMIIVGKHCSKMWFIKYDHYSSYLLKLFFGNQNDCLHLNQIIMLNCIANKTILFNISSF